MLRTTLKFAWRNLWRNRRYTILNLLGLTIALTSAVFILLWVQNERSFDTYHRQSAQTYRVTNTLKVSEEPWIWSSSPLVLGEVAQQRVPGINRISRFQNTSPSLRVRAIWRREENAAYVDSNWFAAFDYTFLVGNPQRALADPNSVVITETKAYTWFGNVAAAVGQYVRIDSTDLVVRAVVRDNPTNSSFQYDVLLPIALSLRDSATRANERNWGQFNYQLFLQLAPAVRPQTIGPRLTHLYRELKKDSSITASLLPLRDIHFATTFQSDNLPKGNSRTATTLALVGLLILIIASINYVNLTTALTGQRAKEVGLKKIIGAGQGRLFGQFLIESMLVVTFVLALTLVLLHALLPYFNAFTGKPFRLDFSNSTFWLILLGSTALTVLLAGVYPALLLSSLRPVSALKGNNVLGVRSTYFRQGLVVTQFVISIILVVSTLVIYYQLHYVRTKDPGYNREHIFTFRVPFGSGYGAPPVDTRDYLKQRISGLKGVVGVTSANQPIVNIQNLHSGSVKYAGKPDAFTPTVSMFSVEPETQTFFGLKLTQGRWFRNDRRLDTANVVLNEAAVRVLGLKHPVVGQWFEFQGQRGQVIGVAKDFHFKSLHQKIEPMVLFYNPKWQWEVMVKVAPGQVASVLAAAESLWKERVPNQPFRYTFLDEQFARLYQAEQQAGQLFNTFSCIAILISCLGLFGLATFAAERRVREIGVRKVLGASVASIVTLLSKDFLKLVLIAIVIASPVAYYAMNRWLEGFAYRVDVEWWVFALAGLLAVGIALLTVSFQSVKAALINPVKSLRSE